jgi:hypothetical protein
MFSFTSLNIGITLTKFDKVTLKIVLQNQPSSLTRTSRIFSNSFKISFLKPTINDFFYFEYALFINTLINYS